MNYQSIKYFQTNKTNSTNRYIHIIFMIAALQLILLIQLKSQTPRCYSDEYRLSYASNNEYFDSSKINNSLKIYSRDIVTIPVVVHIVYNKAIDNISSNQVRSQIDALNFAFSNDNKDQLPDLFKSIASKSPIRFCLAKIDPLGINTNGITRTKTNIITFSNNTKDLIKFNNSGGHSAWNTNKYLNIWVGNMNEEFLGYSSFPDIAGKETDGIIINNRYFGTLPSEILTSPYIFGKTAIHEVGHYLGLCHLPGCHSESCETDDNIDDTPNQIKRYLFTNCLPHPQISCESVDMIMNYMSYLSDPCIWAFTKGQVKRMMNELNSKRSELINSNVCSPNKEFSNTWLKEISSSYQHYNDGIVLESDFPIDQDLYLDIYDVSGRLLHHTNIRNKYIVKINQSFKNGIYILYFYNANIKYSKKIYIPY